MFRQRAYPSGQIDPTALRKALSHKQAMMASQKRPLRYLGICKTLEHRKEANVSLLSIVEVVYNSES